MRILDRSVSLMNENKIKWRKPQNIREGQKGRRPLFSPPLRKSRGKRIRGIGNRIKKLAKPIKTFCESSRDSPSGRTVGFRGVFFFPHYVVCRLVVESDAIKPTVLPYKYRIAEKIEEERSLARCGQSFCLISERFTSLRSLYRRNQPHSSKVPSCNVSDF